MVAKIITKVIGTSTETTAIFRDSYGNIVDPEIVVLSYKRPSGISATLGTTKTGTKHYGKILLNEAGDWYFRWSCDGEYASAIEFKVTVEESKVQ